MRVATHNQNHTCSSHPPFIGVEAWVETEKPALAKKNKLMNLPYLIHQVVRGRAKVRGRVKPIRPFTPSQKHPRVMWAH